MLKQEDQLRLVIDTLVQLAKKTRRGSADRARAQGIRLAQALWDFNWPSVEEVMRCDTFHQTYSAELAHGNSDEFQAAFKGLYEAMRASAQKEKADTLALGQFIPRILLKIQPNCLPQIEDTYEEASLEPAPRRTRISPQ